MSERDPLAEALPDIWVALGFDPMTAEQAAAKARAILAARGLAVVDRGALSVALSAAEAHWDCGPPGEGWQSAELEAACIDLRAMIAAAQEAPHE